MYTTGSLFQKLIKCMIAISLYVCSTNTAIDCITYRVVGLPYKLSFVSLVLYKYMYVNISMLIYK